MEDDILEDIGETDDAEELEVYEDRHKEEAIKDNSKYAPKNNNGGRPKGSPNKNKKNKGPMGEELEDAPSGQNEVMNGVDDYEESLRKEEEKAMQESQPKVRDAEQTGEQAEEQISIVVVKELPMVPQREGIDEAGRKIRFVTTEEFLTMLANR